MTANWKISYFCASLAAGTMLSTPGIAQEQQAEMQPEQSVETDAESGFGAIVVTARRREERLQDIPDSIVAFSADAIEQSGVGNMNDVAALVPNFNIVETLQPGTESINIRGIGQAKNGEPPVAVVIDGVQLSSAYQITQQLFDIERIEVLKGPQGAIYGRNAIGGAINITTRAPSNQLRGGAQISYGTGDDIRAGAFVGLPIIEDKLLLQTSAYYRNFDGDIDNVTLNEPVNFDESMSFRARLLAYLTDDLTVDLRYSHLDQEAGAAWYTFVPTGTSINEKLPVNANVLGISERVLNDASIKIDWEVDFATITSITAYSKVRSDILEDFDFFPSDFLEAEQPISQESWSQEIRIVSNQDGPFEWLLGGYLLETDRTIDSEIYIMPGAGGVLVPFPVPQRTLFGATRANDSNMAYAAFGQLAYELTDDLTVTGALRYDIDDRSTFDRVTGESFDAKFSSFQPKFQLAYSFTEDAMAYVSAGKGFRSGGFNSNGRITRVFDQETNWNYELGARLGLFNNRILFNTAVFYTDIRDRQVYNLDLVTASQVIANPVRSAEIFGYEADVTIRPVKGLQLQASLGLLDTKITDYDETLYVGLPIQGDFTGNKLSKTPEYSYAIAAQYAVSVSDDVELTARAEVNGLGGNFFWEIDNLDKRENITLANARLTAKVGNFSLVSYVSNLFNKQYNLEYVSQAFSGSPFGNYSLPAPGRRFGIEARVRF